MVIECIARVLAFLHLLCSRRCQNKGFGHFPEDILIDILSRLPADAIQQCHRVCRHWRTLTSSSYFLTLQSQRASSVLLQVDMIALEMSVSKHENTALELKREHAALVAQADNAMTGLRRTVYQMAYTMMGLVITNHVRKNWENRTLVFSLLVILATSLLQGLTSSLLRLSSIGGELEDVLQRKEIERGRLTRWIEGLDSDQAAFMVRRVKSLQQGFEGVGDFMTAYYIRTLFTCLFAVFLTLMMIFVPLVLA